MMSDNGRRAEDFCWAALVARVLHPVQVEIIEALRLIDQPLSATELLRVFKGQRVGLRIEHHLRRLRSLNAIEVAASANGNGRIVKYRPTKEPGCGWQ
jgi:hypothetical protein